MTSSIDKNSESHYYLYKTPKKENKKEIPVCFDINSFHIHHKGLFEWVHPFNGKLRKVLKDALRHQQARISPNAMNEETKSFINTEMNTAVETLAHLTLDAIKHKEQVDEKAYEILNMVHTNGTLLRPLIHRLEICIRETQAFFTKENETSEVTKRLYNDLTDLVNVKQDLHRFVTLCEEFKKDRIVYDMLLDCFADTRDTAKDVLRTLNYWDKYNIELISEELKKKDDLVLSEASICSNYYLKDYHEEISNIDIPSIIRSFLPKDCNGVLFKDIHLNGHRINIEISGEHQKLFFKSLFAKIYEYGVKKPDKMSEEDYHFEKNKLIEKHTSDFLDNQKENNFAKVLKPATINSVLLMRQFFEQIFVEFSSNDYKLCNSSRAKHQCNTSLHLEIDQYDPLQFRSTLEKSFNIYNPTIKLKRLAKIRLQWHTEYENHRYKSRLHILKFKFSSKVEEKLRNIMTKLLSSGRKEFLEKKAANEILIL